MNPMLGYDPAVPQRDLLLDTDFVRGRLRRVLGPKGPLRIDECRQVRVKYRVGARLRVLNAIRVGAERFDVAASTFPTVQRSEQAYVRAQVDAVACGLVRAVAHDRELSTVFWTFPNDRKLAHLPALAGPAPQLSKLLPGWSRSILAAYAPEKAATVRCLDIAGRTLAYAKSYVDGDGDQAGRVHEALTRALGPDDLYLRVPRPIAYSPAHRTLVVEQVGGVPLQAPEVPDRRAAYRALGRALARLHELDAPKAPFRRPAPDRVMAAAELIASVRADVAASARALAREISERLDDHDSVCLHGDVNFRNALLENGRVVLIDLDQASAGPAAAELGSVLASLRYAAAIGLIRSAAVPDLGSALLSGYSELRTPPAAPALRAHTAAALLAERCLRVVTRVRPEGLRRLPAMLADAREALA